jgi:SAM-dependent methyltransferase
MTETRNEIEAAAYVDAISARALGEGATPPPSFVGPLPTVLGGEDQIAADVQRAASNVYLGAKLVEQPGVRLRRLKRLILRIAALFTREQHTFNCATVDALRGLEAEYTSLRAELDRRLAGTQATLATIALAGEDASRAARDIEGGLIEARGHLASVSRQRETDRTELRILRARLEDAFRELRRAADRAALNGTGGAPDDSLHRMAADAVERYERSFYADFENLFRGTPDEVKAMVAPYLADVAPVASQGAPVLDVGFGRGDWLELLATNGIPAYGVDTNGHFVDDAVARGLDARLCDVLVHLRGLPDGSLGAVTAMHVVEHLPIDVLISMVAATLRVLRPGGIFILETPNPSNLRVGAASFYLDPTHNRPVPAELLRFIVEHSGFVDVEARFLHPNDTAHFTVGTSNRALEPLRQMAAELNWSLFGPQDYCVVAHRAAA